MNAKDSKKTGRLIFLLCFFIYMVSYFGRYTFSTCISGLEESGIMKDGFENFVSTAFLAVYGIGQIVNGVLTMKIDPKYSITLGLLGSGLSNIAIGLVNNQYAIIVLWALNGFFCSFLWPTVIRIFTEWLDKDERTSAAAGISASLPAGTLTSYLIASLMLKISYRYVFIVSGALIVLGGLIWLASISGLYSKIKEKTEIVSADTPKIEGKKPSLTPMFFISAGLLIVAVTAFFNGALKEGVTVWTPTFLEDTYKISPSLSSLFSTALPIVGIAGPYIGVYLDKKFFRNEILTTAVLYAISAVCCLILVLFGKYTGAIVAALLVAFSVALMHGVNSQILSFIPCRFASVGLSSAITGTLNAFVALGSSILSAVYGKIADATGSWDVLIVMWTLIGAAAFVFCIAFARYWNKIRPKV